MREDFEKIFIEAATSQAFAQLPKKAWNPPKPTPEEMAYNDAKRKWEQKRDEALKALAERINTTFDIHLSLTHCEYGEPEFYIKDKDIEELVGSPPAWEDFEP